MKLLFKIFLLIIMTFPSYGKVLNELTANEAYQIGKDLALHLKTEEAKPYLKYAADNGNTNAMVRYAYLSSSSSQFLSPKSYDYMLKAAQNGHEWAMMSMTKELLSSDADKRKWRAEFIKKLSPYIEKNNPDALYMMSVLEQRDEDEEEDWLIKASDAGSCNATVDLYWLYKKGRGWFLTDNRRNNKVKELAEKGNSLRCIEGKRLYLSWLIYKKAYDKAWETREELIEDGDANAILNGGRYSLPSVFSKKSVLPLNYEKVYIYINIYQKGFGKVSGLKDMYEGLTDLIEIASDELTDKQKKDANSYVKEYLSTHDIKVRDTIWETKFN